MGDTYNKKVMQIVEGAQNAEVDPSTMIAIKNLAAQLTSLRNQITDLQKNVNSTVDADGNNLGFAGLQQTIASFINGSGTQLYQGDVVVRGATAGQVETTTTAGNENTIGTVWGDGKIVLLSALNASFVSTVAFPLSTVPVCQRGLAAVRARTGSEPILMGDLLRAGSVARYAERATPTQPGIFARALQSLSASKSGVIDADINPDLRFNNTADNQDSVTVLTYDTDGTTTGYSGFLTDETVWTDATFSTKIAADHYIYSSDGNLVSAIHSAFAVGGAGSHIINRTVEYSAERLTKIIQDLTE